MSEKIGVFGSASEQEHLIDLTLEAVAEPCEKCGSKQFDYWYDRGEENGSDYNFKKCKQCGAVYLDD